MGPVLQALRLGLLHSSSPSDSGHGNQVPLGWWGGGGHGAASCRSCPVALQGEGGPGQGFGHMQAAGTRLYIDLLRLFVGVPPGRNRVEISAHLDRDPAARERAGNGCNTFNCYQACTVCLCIGLLVLLRRSSRARWSWQWGSGRTVELWRTGRAGPPARRSERMPCGPAARGSGRRPVPQGPPESA